MAEPNRREYHRHDSGDIVQGAAERCIDPGAGAHDVVVLTPTEWRDALADTMRDAAALVETYQRLGEAVAGLRGMADLLARTPVSDHPDCDPGWRP